MSDSIIRLVGVGKMYKVFPSRVNNLLDGLGLARFVFWRRVECREFWALRAIDLEVRRGQRVGVIGRNGAGKTTLLKLLTGNLVPTEGELEIRGTVQPLIEMGAGFHPEFTGYENIRASLAYQGLTPPEIKEAEADIAEFTELGTFLKQPIKTYSLGMLSRLAFATATVVKPEILVIDEVLGAGDAYFLGKSTERMRQLVDSGASVIIVSHVLDQITRFCEDALWLDRGRIVKRGSSLEVVKAYQQYIQILEDRRLKAKNRKIRVGSYSAEEADSYVDSLIVRFVLTGSPGAYCEVESVSLWKDDHVEERLDVGGPQDADTSQATFVMLDGSDWSPPEKTEGGLCRRLECSADDGRQRVGQVGINLFLLFGDAEYAIEMTYRCHGSCRLSLEVWQGEMILTAHELVSNRTGGERQRIPVKLAARAGAASADAAQTMASSGALTARAARRWPGEGSLVIEEVMLLDAEGREQAVFRVGTPMTLGLTFRARRGGMFNVLPAATLYRLDGVLVSNHPGETYTVELEAGDRRELRLEFGPLNLGNSHYVFSVALYRRLSHLEASEPYDLIDRSYEFEVVGNGPFENGIFRHPGEWRLL